MLEKNKHVMGIDVGGTKIAFALANNKGKIVNRKQIPTRVSDGPQRIIKRIIKEINILVKATNLSLSNLGGLGCALPGLLNVEEGKVVFLPNVSGWEGLPIKSLLEDQLKIPCFIHNDASLAALGEKRFGAGVEAENLIYFTLSTGIGGGIIIDGELYTGKHGTAGEFGHMVVMLDGPECGCHRRGCWEAVASGAAIAKRAREAIAAGKKTVITTMVNGNLSDINAGIVIQAARQKDPLATEIMNDVGRILGIEITSCSLIFDPDMIVIGGGLSLAGDIIFDPIRNMLRSTQYAVQSGLPKVVPAKLGADAGVQGAIALALKGN